MAFPFKKVILIVIVTWIASLATSLAFVYVVVPSIIKPTWHSVTSFSGTFQGFDIEETDIFYIPSDHWRLHWSVATDEPPPEDVEFRLFLSPNITRGGYFPSLVWLTAVDFQGSVSEFMKWWGTEDGTEYLTGSGWYTLRLLGARLDWEITVEAYY